MSLLTSFEKALQGSIAAADRRQARSMQEKNIQLAEEAAGYKRDSMDMSSAMALAQQLDITKNGGLEIDVPKLSEILETGRKNQKFNPQAEQLAALLGNTDYSARKNKGFSFGGLSIGPDETLTLKGSYEGQEGQKYATTAGGPGAEEEVAFAPVVQVAQLLADQYNQMWARRANAGTYNEIRQKQKLAGTFDQVQENRQIVRKAVGDLREQVDLFLSAPGRPPAYAAASRKLKSALSQPNLSDDDKLDILRDFGSQLDLPVGEIVTPEVENAIVEAKKTAVPNAQSQAEPQAEPVDNTAKIEELERKKRNISPARGGRKRIEVIQKEIDRLKAGGSSAAAPASESRTGPATDQEIAEFRKQNPKLFPSATRERLAELVEGEKFGYKRSAASAAAPEVQSLAKKAEESVASGGEQVVRATAEELTALKEALKADGVESFADLNKTTRENQIAILAVLSSAPYVDETQRAVFKKELTNLTETGTLSYDAKTLAAAENDARTTRVSEANSLKGLESLQQEVGEKTAVKVQKAQESFRDALYGVGEGKDRQISNELQWRAGVVRNKVFGSSGAFSQLFEEYAAADDAVRDGASGVGNISGRKRDRLRRELNSMYSQVVQAMNESGKYEWSWLTRDTAEGVITDDTFQRIRLKADETGFEVVDPSSGQATGDTIPASDIAKIMGPRYFEDFKNELKAAKR